MDIRQLHAEIEKDWPRHLEATRKLLRIPSVSMTGEGIQESADAVEDMVADLGAKHGQFRAGKKSHPLVHGYLDVGAKKTGLIYGMYDVQPVGDLKEWDYPPFGATITKRKPHGKVLINRGVANSKAALAGNLLAVKTMLEHDALPMNLRFLLEGEEEIGGYSLPKWVHRNKATLSKADAAFTFDYGEDSNGTAQISLGAKGCVYFDLIAEAAARGGPTAELHSSCAVVVESPVWRLTHALSTMVDENQDPSVDGIWDKVQNPSKEDLALIRQLAKRFDPDAFLKEMNASKFKCEGSKEEMIRKYIFEPSINIDGLIAGYQDEGTKTVLPPRAMAKIDIRTVPNMTVEDTKRKVMDHLRRRGFTDIRMREYVDYPWSKVPFHEPISQACIETLRFHGKDPEIWPMSAGSAPMYLFDQVLGVPWGSVGLGHAGNAHSPNEYAVVDGMREFEKSVVTVLWKFVEISEGQARA
ncbi:MAG: M20/M25/M40 family metallo-hydrolase [Thermoplasmata archaeon]|jgi:acetylornithine deacetylase/succinyl-diaminopimelate desuccinylase-like protein|nr:M20/M25/M40 family metallo-hydrolase [Thermoplasmata archaeon]